MQKYTGLRDRFAEYQFGQRPDRSAPCCICHNEFPECHMHEHWQRDWELVCEGCYGDGTDEFGEWREIDDARRGREMSNGR